MFGTWNRLLLTKQAGLNV